MHAPSIVINELAKMDIFEKTIRDKTLALRSAMFTRRAALNATKTGLFKSHYKYKLTAAYNDQLAATKDAITFLTIRINKLSVMIDKNIIDEDIVAQIEHDYKKQL